MHRLPQQICVPPPHCDASVHWTQVLVVPTSQTGVEPLHCDESVHPCTQSRAETPPSLPSQIGWSIGWHSCVTAQNCGADAGQQATPWWDPASQMRSPASQAPSGPTGVALVLPHDPSAMASAAAAPHLVRAIIGPSVPRSTDRPGRRKLPGALFVIGGR